MEKKLTEEEIGRADRHTILTNLPPGGSGGHAPHRGTSAGTSAEGTTTAWVTPPTVVTHLRFGTPNPPTILRRARWGIVRYNNNTADQQDRFTPLSEQGSES